MITGIDEAGYGPLLGPLVMTAVALAAPAASADSDLWGLLDTCVARRVRRRDPRLVITDSKDLSSRRDGLSLLETAALSLLAVMGQPAATFRELLSRLCPDAAAAADGYPWYRAPDFALPVAVAREQVDTQTNALRYGLNQAGFGLEHIACEILDVARFNEIVAKTDNKATVLFSMTLRLIARTQSRAAGRACSIVIDKQGGRSRYRGALMTGLELDDLHVLEESAPVSVYAGAAAGDHWRMEFRENAERHSLPAAAASIVSKYVRELFMLAFNQWWSERVPGLRRTAGYYQDGRRFLRDVAAVADQLGIDRRILVRSR